ncbi:MAG: DUF5689 domain-containing protein [Flavobacteriaceae bacterium]|jgi:hypothetical protein|nr:DUF5689 domain-containing protein [Flavobacteriaceae bacterium]
MKITKIIQRIMILFVISLSFMACVHDDDYNEPTKNEGEVLIPTITIPQVHATAPTYTGLVNDTVPESITFAKGAILEGYVISTDQGGNVYKNLFIVTDDGKKGVMLSINESNIYTHYPLGAKIYVKLEGLYYGKQNGMVQIGMKPTQSTKYIVDQIPPNVMASNIILGKDKKDEEDLVIKTNSSGKPLTVDDVKGNEAYLCTLAEISEVSFNDAGSTFVRGDANTDNQVNSVNIAAFTARVSNYANFAGYKIPSGKGKVRGVVTRYDKGTDKIYQFLIRTIDDVKFDTPVFEETFTNCKKSDGSSLSSPWAKIANIVGFDGGALVKYSDPTGYTDVRFTSSINNHAWFPANRNSSLVITGINTTGHSKLKLSYSIRTNYPNVSKADILKVKCNGVDLTIPPSLTMTNSGYVTVEIDNIPSSPSLTLEFSTTVDLNTVGIRLDNIKIAEVK